LIVAAIAGTLAAFPSNAEAQRRGAVRRPAIVVRPPVVVRARPTVFVGGFYYPSLYRPSLYYGYGGYYGDGGYYRPYYAGSPYYQGPYGYRYDLSGNVRTQVAPRQTEVFIDGYYAGTADDFDGVFQRLHIEPGEHDVELYLPGHHPYQQRVYVQPGRTFSIRHTMQPLAAGEPEPARPNGAPLPPPGGRDPGVASRQPPGDPRGAGPDPRNTDPGARVPSAAAQGFGQLSLRVQPGDAEVFIDGEKWEGATAADRLDVQLGAGVHRLEIRKDGYRSYFTDVTIGNGQTRTLNVALTRN
jgi:hypothetical protein